MATRASQPGLLGDLGQEGAELTHVTGTGLRVDVATIHEGVDANGLDTVLGSHLDQSLDVAHMRMNTARAHKAHEVESLAVSLDVVHSLDEDLVLGDGAVLDGIVDARKLLEHDAAGTDVEVTHLGVAHLTRREGPHPRPKHRAWCEDTSRTGYQGKGA